MKIKNIFSIALILFSLKGYTQEKKENFESLYVTVTTLHGSNFVDYNQWIAVEKEYFNKVTDKIDLILSHEVLVNYFTNDFSEIKVINVFKNWDDIQYINKIRDDLIKEAWPDEKKRSAFFEKQNSFYTNYHSDEIYITSSLSKKMTAEERKNNNKPLIYFMDTNILADKDPEESNGVYIEYLNKVVYENPFIRAYYPFRHFWGADSREFIELMVVNSLSDLEKALEKNKELLESYIPDVNKRKAFFSKYNNMVSDHKTGVYKNIPQLSK